MRSVGAPRQCGEDTRVESDGRERGVCLVRASAARRSALEKDGSIGGENGRKIGRGVIVLGALTNRIRTHCESEYRKVSIMNPEETSSRGRGNLRRVGQHVNA